MTALHKLPSHSKIEFCEKSSHLEKLLERYFPKNLFDGAGVAPFKSKADGTTVHQLVFPTGSVFYLKLYPGPTWRKVVKRFITGQWPASTSADEYRAAKLLQAKSIPVMNAVAWGELRLLGLWPTRNFILSEEVKGIELYDMLSLNRGREDDVRLRLLEASAKLMADMHTANLFLHYRPNDLFCLNPQAPEGEAYLLKIIDPDVKGRLLEPADFQEQRAYEAMSYLAYMMLRCRMQLNTPSEYKKFMRAYQKTLEGHGIKISRNFGKSFRAHLNKRLEWHYQNPVLSQNFSYVPRHLSGRLGLLI